MNKTDLINEIYDSIEDEKLTKKLIKQIFDKEEDLIYSNVKKGKKVKIGLGTFYKKHYDKRKGYDAKNQKYIEIPERDKFKFDPMPRYEKFKI